ncbi:hypothetical protein K443DRAFT_292891 [Laccaria amethystina LaAM-08-1]|uniref:Uncharacterized protein n=1 Tax=Laccaria amethystina LaAM-08-1 TaxID=1095629 RepID=A0A0C9X4N4_9AGAR|nr:hypothetical protein K443DRAFT_292891 [Laccaria amethystina LaAM-08-1]
MKVDSPSFFKDDEYENIKVDEYHDSGKDSKGQLGDEDNPLRDPAFLEFLLQQLQKENSYASFAQPSPIERLIDPGPSHFHPFDISLSKPKVDDWDVDTKLDEYRDFGKVSI